MNWAQVIPGLFALAGALMGSTASLLSARWSQRHQRQLESDRQAKERERAASLIAREAVVKLLQLDPKPSERFEYRAHWAMRRGQPQPPEEDRPSQELDDVWIKEWKSWLLQLQVVIGEFSDDEFRQRLKDLHTTLTGADSWWEYMGAVESVTRYRVCHHLLDCLGRYGRGAPLEPMPEDVQEAWSAMQEQIEFWDLEHERQKQEIERLRKADREALTQEGENAS
ncbi:hypothetical protein ACU635_53380 [[Actinomadura] parvosata]|uniref:hypothetical protein n=1 Tax=[Actinomadura] parvosata TaxID=1955412 RepID=UPI00406CF131